MIFLVTFMIGCSSTPHKSYKEIRYACANDELETNRNEEVIKRCIPVDLSYDPIYWHGYRPYEKIEYDLPDDLPE